MTNLITVQSSNADSEREFSILHTIHTDQLPSINKESIIASMVIKFYGEEYCHDSVFNKELLTKCKSIAPMVRMPRRYSRSLNQHRQHAEVKIRFSVALAFVRA